MNAKASLFISLVLGLMGGLLAVGIRLSYDPWFEQWVKNKILTSLTEGFTCNYVGEITSLSLFPAVIEFKNVTCTDNEKQWYWKAGRIRISFSWFRFFFKNKIGIVIDSYDVFLESKAQSSKKYIAFQRYIQEWLSSQRSLPLELLSIHIHDLQTVCDDEYDKVSFLTSGSLHLSAGLAYITGIFTHGESSYVKNMEGNYRFVISSQAVLSSYLHVTAGLLSRDRLIKATIFWEKENGHYRLQGNDLFAEGVFSRTSISLNAKTDMSYFGLCKGFLDVQGTFYLPSKTWSSTITLEKFHYKGISIPDCTFKLKGNDKKILGDSTISYMQSSFKAHGVWNIHNQQWNIALENSEECLYPFLGKASVGATILTLEGTGKCIRKGCALVKTDTNELSLTMLHDALSIIMGKHTVEVKGLFSTPSKALYTYDAVPCINASLYDDHFFIEANIHGMENIIHDCGYDMVKGEGKIFIKGDVHPNGLEGDIHFSDAHIRLAHLYNIIHRGRAHVAINVLNRSLVLSHGVYELSKGCIEIPRLSCAFSDEGKLIYALVPMMIHECFVHWKKDIIGYLSGFLVSRISGDELPHIFGQLYLDNAFVQSNILSSDFRKIVTGGIVKPFTLYPFDARLDIRLTSSEPIKVKTPFLETAMLMSLGIKGTINAYQLLGSLNLDKGMLNFPFKPLYITSGHVYFLPNQLDDPMIELTARNTLQKYIITLHVSGPVSQPRILFESSPPLTEGQIITLLLGGSDDGSLFFAMPTSLSTTIENLIFGPVETLSATQRSLRNIFSSLRKMVRIVPSFSDEKGRGGVRGSLLIDVNDRLHAKVQTNFTLSEDTTFDIEYALSDTMALHIVKDERRDLGVELEKVWKF